MNYVDYKDIDDSDIVKVNYTPDKSNAKPMDYIFDDFPELEDFTPSDDEVCGYVEAYDINNER